MLHSDFCHPELHNLLRDPIIEESQVFMELHFSAIAITLVGVAITLVSRYLSLRIIEISFIPWEAILSKAPPREYNVKNTIDQCNTQ